MIDFSLRTRFVATILATVSIAFAGFYIAVDQFLDVLEAQLLDRTLSHELHEFAADYRRDPTTPPPSSAGLTAYVVTDGDTSKIPSRLNRLMTDWPESLHIDGVEYLGGRTDVGDTQLYLLLDVQPVDELQQRLETVAWISGITAMLAAIIVALSLVRLVTNPMRRIAQGIANTDPGVRDERISFANIRGAGREFAMIASAFDRFLERMDQFVAREQAFTEDAGHELRTPLAVILSSLQLLETDASLSDKSREKVQRIQRAAEQMQAQIEALMFLAREEARPEGETCDMQKVVANAVQDSEQRAAMKDVRIEVESVPLLLEVPAAMAISVVSNLLQNAIHHTENGYVVVKLMKDRLTVEDTGSGIAPADLSNIFERRFRGPQSRGLGLGLYLIKRICDRLGWTVRAESRPGTGARFIVIFSSALTKS